MSIILQDGILVKGPYPADKKLVVGTAQEYATKEFIPIQYRYIYMVVTNVDTGFRYELQSDLTTWTQFKEVPDWVALTQVDVALASFGGNLDWTRITNAPTYTELDPVVFSVVTLPSGSDATVNGVHPNFTLGLPTGSDGAPGVDGTKGVDGLAATIAVGTTSTGATGSSAVVTNSGTVNTAIFDFVIPEGPAGVSATLDVGTTTTGSAGPF